MLILTRKDKDKVFIFNKETNEPIVEITTFITHSHNKIKLGFNASDNIRIVRDNAKPQV